MQAYARLFTVMAVTGILAVAVYFGAENGWGRLAPVEVVMAPGANNPFLYQRIQASLVGPLSRLEGQWLWQVSLPKVMALVEKDRRIQEVRVTRGFPNRLQVMISPKKPVLAWVDEAGRFFPMAADASLLPPLPTSEALDMPLMRGKNFQKIPELREKAIELIQELPASGVLNSQSVSEITYSEKFGFSLLISGGIEIRMGEGEYGPKTSRVQRVLNYLQDQQLRGRVIDARFAKKVVVRLRNAP